MRAHLTLWVKVVLSRATRATRAGAMVAPFGGELPPRGPGPGSDPRRGPGPVAATDRHGAASSRPPNATSRPLQNRIQAALRSQQLSAHPVFVEAYGAAAEALVAVITKLVAQTEVIRGEVEAGFGRHPDAEIKLSQPGLGPVPAARVLAETGDDPDRYADAKARTNYSGMSPITRASGTKRVVLARYARNRRLADALYQQAFTALTASPGARAYYDRHRARGATHHQALRALTNRLVGLLHGCLRHHQTYDEHRLAHPPHSTPIAA